MNNTSLICVGECMLELSERPDGSIVRAFGGDSLNTAVYARRRGVPVSYVTALGDDPFSGEMVAAWADEGLTTSTVRRVAGRVPGLYWIKTDAAGERSFSYWRDAAPYRDLFRVQSAHAAFADLRRAKWLYLTGISLAVLDVESRLGVFEAMREVVEAGGQVAFDINYRPQLWEDVAEAASTLQIALAWSTIALPGLEDMRTVFGATSAQAALRQLEKLWCGGGCGKGRIGGRASLLRRRYSGGEGSACGRYHCRWRRFQRRLPGSEDAGRRTPRGRRQRPIHGR